MGQLGIKVECLVLFPQTGPTDTKKSYNHPVCWSLISDNLIIFYNKLMPWRRNIVDLPIKRSKNDYNLFFDIIWNKRSSKKYLRNSLFKLENILYLLKLSENLYLISSWSDGGRQTLRYSHRQSLKFVTVMEVKRYLKSWFALLWLELCVNYES